MGRTRRTSNKPWGKRYGVTPDFTTRYINLVGAGYQISSDDRGYVVTFKGETVARRQELDSGLKGWKSARDDKTGYRELAILAAEKHQAAQTPTAPASTHLPAHAG